MKEKREQERREKPVLDEHKEVQLIEEAIIESYREHRSITLSVFNPFDDEETKGVIISIDRQSRRVKLVRGDEDYSWIQIEEIIKAGI
ncbi:YolD-like family protein [Paenibacillus polysaccharolyticus]|nr:YolD-like family protein [Paenibacillus polysaccharolyticus]